MGRALKMLEDEFRARQYDPKKLGLRMMEAGVGIMHSKKTPDSKEDEQKKRYEMPADEYGKMIDRTMGESKGRLKGDYNEEPDTAPVRKAKGGMVKKSKPKATKSRGDGIAQRGKTKGRMV